MVIGSSNTDMTVRSRVLPGPGETVLGGDFMMGYGGKGANQAVAAKRLGGNILDILRVGYGVVSDGIFYSASSEYVRKALFLQCRSEYGIPFVCGSSRCQRRGV